MKIYNEKIDIRSEKIDRDYIFCVMSDVHITKGTNFKQWDKVIQTIAKQKPDYIFVPGDIVNIADDLLNNDNKKKIEYLFNKLGQITKTFVSLGNHDLKDGKKAKAMDTIRYLKGLEKIDNIYVLNNETINIDNITVTGFSPRYESYYEKDKEYWVKHFIDDLQSCLYEYDEKKYNIFLTHSPVIISKKETLELLREVFKDLDLILCGHMHDGLMPKFIQKIGLIKNDKGIAVSEVDAIKDFRIRIVEKCRGTHDFLNAKIIVTRGARKWADNNPICNQVDKICSKDITTIRLIKK